MKETKRQKRILLIMPRFYGYENYIRQSIEKKGFDVNCIFENLSEFNRFYLMLSIMRSDLKERYLINYYKKKISAISGIVDFLIVIRGSTLCYEILMEIKLRWPEIQMLLYQWDSVSNNPNAQIIAPFFKKVYTFDMHDAKEFGWIYRPLFYIDNLIQKEDKEYDITFICMLHSNRVEIMEQLDKISNVNGYNSFLYIYTYRLSYLRHHYILKDPVYANVHNIPLKYKTLSIEETNKIYNRTRVIVDYTHPGQNGLTMRTIESIGHKCKLITNNKNIIHTDFYNENNIFVYDGMNPQITYDFLNKPFCEYDARIYKKYSLNGFIGDILNEKPE